MLEMSKIEKEKKIPTLGKILKQLKRQNHSENKKNQGPIKTNPRREEERRDSCKTNKNLKHEAKIN